MACRGIYSFNCVKDNSRQALWQALFPESDIEFYVKCPQAAYGPSKMSTQVTTMHSVK